MKPKTVLASGVFDLLHLGHVRYLEEARKIGGPGARLVVIVARDTTVLKRRGVAPIMPEDQRVALVESLKVVDKAVLGHENFDMGRIIEEMKPDVIALGYDRGDLEEEAKKYVKTHGLKTIVVKVGKFDEAELNSSSKIKQRIIEQLRK
ncbi:FAD synthase [Candidatus Bathyarchaeota archaeon]|nr:FAD synthase [Candidatus Bathyarchaeota archaeon]